MLNLLFVIDKYNGNYPLFNEMVNLDKNKFRVFVCYFEGKDDNKDEIVKVAEKVYYLNIVSKFKTIKKINTIKSISEIININNIDIVNCQLEKTMFSGIASVFFAKKDLKLVVTIHGLVGGNTNRITKKIKNYFLFNFVDKIVCVSKSIKKDVIRENYRLPENKVVCVQNGLVYDRFLSGLSVADARFKVLPSCNKPFWFGSVGRLAEKKNVTNLILAVDKLKEMRQDFVLVLAGSGPLEKNLKQLVERLNLHNYVVFLGNRSDVPDVLKSFDVFLFPTFREGLPLALLEAMSVGLPVIASDIDVVKEVFGGEDLGRLVSPHDPSQIASAMLDLMNLPSDQLAMMGEISKRRARESFSSEKMIKEYEFLYQALSSTGDK